MKRIAVIVALAALPSMPALIYAQTGKPAAKPAEKPAAAAPASAAKTADKPAVAADSKAAEKAAAAPGAKPVARKAGRSRDTRDARACLKFATNTEIIKCAEKYR